MRLPRRELTEEELLEKLTEQVEKAKRMLSMGRQFVLARHLRQGDYCFDRAVRHLACAQQLLRRMKR